MDRAISAWGTAWGTDLLRLDGNDTRELLDAVEESVSLLDGLLVQRVLAVGPVAKDNPLNLINLATKTATCNKLRELVVEESRPHPKRRRH